MSYKHDQLVKRIATIDEEPGDESARQSWLRAEGHLELLRENAKADELIVSTTSGGFGTWVHSMVISEDRLDPIDLEDLLQWSAFQDMLRATYVYDGRGVRLEKDDFFLGDASTLSDAHPLVFLRNSLDQNDKYYEVLQEYAHLEDIHWRKERNAYSRFDKVGDWEDVVSVTIGKTSLASFKRESLDYYLAVTGSALVRLFDFRLGRSSGFDDWPLGQPDFTNIAEDTLFYRSTASLSGAASITRGVQIIRTRLERPVNTYPFPEQESNYVAFTAWDFRNKQVRDISTDPLATTNYYDRAQDLPFEMSPAFFRAEVLSKYKADRDKYTIDETSRSIWCRNAWQLKYSSYANDAGQIHVYICDLRGLPYGEQVYWQSFNEEPKAGISEQAYQQDFQGKWIEDARPLEEIRSILRHWDESGAWWWDMGIQKLEDVNNPLAGSRDDWANSFQDLATLIIEGFAIKSFRKYLHASGIEYKNGDGSLALLERTLDSSLEGLRMVQRIRSTNATHRRGTNANELADTASQHTAGYIGHFENVCRGVATELRKIETRLTQAAV